MNQPKNRNEMIRRACASSTGGRIETEWLETRRLFAGPSFAFAPPTTIPTPSDTAVLLVADMNNDSKPDVITIGSVNSESPSRIAISLGNGNGTFQAPTQVIDFGTVLDIGAIIPDGSVGDINRDGKPDLVVVRQNDAAIYVFTGNGNGTLNSPTRIAMPSGNSFSPRYVSVGDFNNDQWPDVAAGRFDDSRLVFFNGGSTFGGSTRVLTLPNSNTTYQFASADFDTDGVLDLAVQTLTGAIVIRALNTSNPQFNGIENAYGGRLPQGMTVGRLLGPNGPPGLNLASTSLGLTNRIIRVPNPTTQGLIYPYDGNDLLTSMTSGDFNGDGYDDVIAGGLQANAFIPGTGRSNGDIDFNLPLIRTDFMTGSYRSADFNGDGLLDFIAGGGSGGAKVYLQKQQSLVVTTAVDEDDGNAFADVGTGVSLREAFNYAKQLGGNQTITFAPALGNANAVLNITGDTLAVGGLPNPSTLTIRNDTGRITLRGNGTKTLFTVPFLGVLTLENLNITNFRASDASGSGGAAYVSGYGTLNVYNSTLYGNTASATGSAIYGARDAVVTVRNSTFNGNVGQGAIAVDGFGSSGPLIENNTIVGNTGGGVFLYAGGTRLFNNIIAGNTGGDLAVVTGGFTGDRNIIQTGPLGSLANTINAAPALSALADNGGRTLTMMPTAASPAIDAGAVRASVPADQRGIARPQLTAPDLGAVEARASDLGLPNVTAADGALWYLAGSSGNDQRIYRQAPGQAAVEVGGAASFIALQGDGNVVVRTAAGAVFTRDGSANSIGTGWNLRSAAVAGDNATWFFGTDGSGGNFNIYRWSANGTDFASAGGSGARIGSLAGLIVTQAAGGTVSYRNGSNAGLGNAWVQTVTATAGDGATWFIFATIGSNGSIYRWDTGGTFGDSTGVGSALAVQVDGSILARNGGAIYTRVGSTNGLGTSWSLRPSVTSGGGAPWFLGTDGPSGQFNIYRWGLNGQFNFTNGWGVRLGTANGAIVFQNAGGIVFYGPDTSGGLGSGWLQVNSAVAGDGATWFVSNGVGFNGDTYRWAANSSPQTSNLVSISLLTSPDGSIRARNSLNQLLQRVGSSTGLGTVWRVLTESLVVNTAIDENDFSSSANLGSGTSLREAIAYANAKPGPDTITFAAGLNGQTIASAFGWDSASDDTTFRISGDLTIDGGSQVTLGTSSGNGRRLFLSTGGTFTLKNATISGITTSGQIDGAALWTNGTAVIDNVRFQNNQAQNGGAIANYGTVTATNSTFQSNSATDTGGAISNGGTLSVSNSLFYLNSAVNGGAINSGNGLTIDRVTFSGNQAGFNGGGLRLFGTSTVSNSTFSNNSAVNGGGGLISHGNTALTNVTIAYNTALDGGGAQFFEGSGTLRFVTFAYNTATRSGGGLAVNTANATLTNTLVAGNGAADQNDIWGSLNAASSNNLLNVSSTAAKLGGLAFNGGPTATVALLVGSPAANTGLAINGITTDQRGVNRSQGSAPDIGAYESSFPGVFVAPTVSITAVSNSPTRLSPVTFRVTFSKTLAADPLLANFVVGNGSASAITKNTDGTYDVQVLPAGQGTVSLQLPANAVQDTDTLGNTASNTASITFDSVAPTTTVVLTPALPNGLNGFYTGPVAIVLSGVDLTSGVATTYYSLDDGPAQVYTGQFQVGSDGPHALQFWSVDQAGNTESAQSTQFKIDATAPAIAGGLLVNGANGATAGGTDALSRQRSMVKSLVIGFSEPVTLASDALQLLTSTGAAVPGVTISVAASTDGRTFTVTFSGSAVVGGSLADGRYQLRVRGAGVRDVAGNSLAADQCYNFVRYFGDVDGDGLVGSADLAAFNTTYGKAATSPAFLWYFDFDGNGAVNNTDYLQFQKRYNKALP